MLKYIIRILYYRFCSKRSLLMCKQDCDYITLLIDSQPVELSHHKSASRQESKFYSLIPSGYGFCDLSYKLGYTKISASFNCLLTKCISRVKKFRIFICYIFVHETFQNNFFIQMLEFIIGRLSYYSKYYFRWIDVFDLINLLF